MLNQEDDAMPFCTQCGNQVAPTAAYCGSCGARQPGVPAGGYGPAATPPPATGEDWLLSLSPGTASLLCYIPFVGWVAALVFLATRRFQNDATVRFHAFQGLYLFVAWLLVDIALGVTFGFTAALTRRSITGLLKLSILGGWIYMLVKTAQGVHVRLPFLGELADRSVAEEQSTPRP